MKKVVNGKLYNTETAEEICEWSNSYYSGDLHYCEETLYKTKKCNWFLYGKGGALSEYSKPCEGNGSCGSSNTVPMTKEEAIEWLEERDYPNILMEHFPEAVEEA